MPYYHCLENDGAGIFNIRSSLDEEFLPCESLRQCCEINNIKEETPKVESPKSCGYRNSHGLGYFSMGKNQESQFGEFPWAMAVLKKNYLGSTEIMMFMGGGSLIHPSVVLTTAHNLNNSKSYELAVRGGEWNTQSRDEMFPHQERDVAEIIYHQNFTRSNLQNDIALLFVSKPFELAPHLNTICFPQPNYKQTGGKCFVSGWGKDKVRKMIWKISSRMSTS